MAEAHPVGFRWVMKAKERGATILHVDPRFSRTSALADIWVPIRAGSDIVFLGGLIRHIIENDLFFRDYVVPYTNASCILSDEYRDPEDNGDGYFSGWNEERRAYEGNSWLYKGGDVSRPQRDLTLQDPQCVFRKLKRHFSRYTPEMVEKVCGIPPELFHKVADALVTASGPDKTAAICYAVGWTQHSKGVQMIRTAAMLQLLLGNIGRPGGGILALRGHASIQGSTDIPTLYDILPGYLPMPHAKHYGSFDNFMKANTSPTGWWGHFKAYWVSLMKAYFGQHATADNDWLFKQLPRVDDDNSVYWTVEQMLEGRVKGYIVAGENPAVGNANGKAHRLGFAKLDWLVVRDLVEIESASFWYDSPEIETGELVTEQIPTEVFFMPAAAHTEKDGSFTNTQRLLQWHWQAVEPKKDCRSELWFYFHLGRLIKQKLADSRDPRDELVQHLRWEYPTHSQIQEPDAESVLAEISGWEIAS